MALDVFGFIDNVTFLMKCFSIIIIINIIISNSGSICI